MFEPESEGNISGHHSEGESFGFLITLVGAFVLN